jgi:hypothetical protein
MNLTLKQLLDCVMGRNIPTEFANENIDYEAALRDEIKKLAGTYSLYRRNKYEIFDLLAQNAEEVLPRKVIELIGAFAEVGQYGNNDRLSFRIKRGAQRGKQFVTRATESGVYETFRLDHDYVELNSITVAGAGIIDFERYLDGMEDIADIYNIIVEGMTTAIFREIQGCLAASWNDTGRPARNKVSANTFDYQKMAQLVQVVSAYGAPVIYCSALFASTMLNVVATPDGKNHVGERDMDEIREYGYIGKFAGAPVVVIPNSFEDEMNDKLVFDPRFAYVIPAGKEKLVKVALVGQTIIDEWKNADRSMEIQGYKKFGVGIVSAPNFWGIYYNSGIEAWGHGEITE